MALGPHDLLFVVPYYSQLLGGVVSSVDFVRCHGSAVRLALHQKESSLIMQRKGYTLAKITERTVSGMSRRFECACGREHLLGVYVAAHYHEKLWHSCECGRKNLVQSGVVLTQNKLKNDVKKS